MAGQVQYNYDSGNTQDDVPDVTEAGLTLAQFKEFYEECKAQPSWRTKADKEADYLDGNQLDSDVIRKQQAIGLPPAIDPLMGVELDDLCGLEARLRKNWRVVPNSDTSDDQIAEALNARLNVAERHAKADKACSDAFRQQSGLGVGWIEVSRNPNPFEFPYRAVVVPRNEVFWDWKGSLDPAGMDHRYRIRRRWTDKTQAKLAFPDMKDLIEQASTNWSTFSDYYVNDGGRSTGLQMGGGAIMMSGSGAPTMLGGTTPGTYALLSTAYATEQTRGLTIEEQEWRDLSKKRICIFEVWYRVWMRALVLKSPDGRTVELDQKDPRHIAAVASGAVEVMDSVISKVRVSMWLGPHRLSDQPTPYKHNKFPYVPFWGKREDRTGVPYGLARGWIYPQDTHNALSSKLRWGVSAARTTRTEGAYVGTDEQLHAEAARIDADIILSAEAMAKDGAMFKIERDFELNDQQLKLMEEARNSIKRTGGGLQPDGNDKDDDAEQVPNMHGILFDNFKESRNEVGELLLSMIIEDLTGKETPVVIKGNVINPDKTVVLNQRTVHPVTGQTMISNDISATLLKVVLEDVPSTPSYRGQQMQSLSEVVKSAPEQFQSILFPYLLSLTDAPDKDKMVAAIREASTNQTPEQIQQQIDQAVQQALLKANIQLKTQELSQKKELQDMQIQKLAADTVLQRVTAMYEALEAGGVVTAAPGAAPVGDAILQGAGYTPPNPAGVSPDIENVKPVGDSGAPAMPVSTHPNLPAHPPGAGIGAKQGIEAGIEGARP